MIKATEKTIEFKGSITNICTEMTLILRAFKEFLVDKTDEDTAVDMFSKVLKMSSMSDDEIRKERAKREEKLEKAIKAFEALLEEDEEDE